MSPLRCFERGRDVALPIEKLSTQLRFFFCAGKAKSLVVAMPVPNTGLAGDVALNKAWRTRTIAIIYFILTSIILLVSIPKMSTTLTINWYLPADLYS